MENLELLERLIVGRTEPVIYAFSTGKVPGCLKVGDTYRPLNQRLSEWRKHFPDLHEEFHDKATAGEGVFFRDYAVHQYLETELGKKRLQDSEIPHTVYYSREFFRNAKAADVKAALADIREHYRQGSGKYRFYSADTHLPKVHAYASTGMWEPRPNQAAAAAAFKKAVDAGRTNLLMYAVMRFGKSFTALLCAKEMKARLVLVVSAKADVREEWKKNVQSADNFNAEYTFLDSEALDRDARAIKRVLREGRGAVVFLTLQDLQGDTLKKKHKELFGSEVDLLIVDETHYGARAEKYGQVLRTAAYERDVRDPHAGEDAIDIEEAREQMKALHARITLHLSGTPYRILMGSEFSKEDIVAFCQFSDIVREQEKWDEEHLSEDDKKEWDNPYYGFPQMIRFAFHPTKAAVRRLESLRENGVTYAFSALFQPLSVKKDEKRGRHRKFVYEEEVLDLFRVIDGSRQEEGLLGFLDYDKIKDGGMCRHMVCVLPYCASCDALEALIEAHREEFKNLGGYVLLNISGVDRPKRYRSVQDIKDQIRECEERGQKTLTLTVNRMLTGSTVEQWDTMLYFKDTVSPQEYDQAIFRLQNQYVRTMVDENGDTIRLNRKPQTLLVDFDPHRMFIMQEQKSLIYNVNTEESGNDRLRERIAEELRISPIITLNGDRIEQVRPVDILSAVSAYSNSRGVLDETRDIPVDLSLLDFEEVCRAIERQAAIGSVQGFETEAYEGDETDLEISEEGEREQTESGTQDEEPQTEEPQTDREDAGEETEARELEARFRTYYARVLFYAFLTKDAVSSLEDVLLSMDKGENPRIAANLGLDRGVLRLFRQYMNVFVLSRLDYKIQNINRLANDDSVPPVERALTAIRKFERLSSAEVATPGNVTEAMVGLLPDQCFLELAKPGHVIWDIASKAGEYAIAVVRRCEKLGYDVSTVARSVLSIPTSSVAYEFTRKIYEVLGLDTGCIAERFYSHDLLGTDGDEEAGEETGYEDIWRRLAQTMRAAGRKEKEHVTVDSSARRSAPTGAEMKFEAIIGNPPYQEVIHTDTDNRSLSRQLFPYYIMAAMEAGAKYVSLITPARWFAGDAQDKSFIKLRNYIRENNHIRSMYYYQDAKELFANVEIKGGVQYFLSEQSYEGEVDFYVCAQGERKRNRRSLFTDGMDIIINDVNTVPILSKVRAGAFVPLTEITTGRNAFGIIGKPANVEAVSREKRFKGSVPLRCKSNVIRWMKPDAVKKNVDIFGNYKVFVSKSAGNPNSDTKVIGYPYVGEPFSACTDSLIPIGSFGTREEAEHLAKYIKTRFVRFLVQVLKSSQNVTQIVYRFVPMQDFTDASDIDWSGSVEEIEGQLYKKYGLTQEEIDYVEAWIKPMD